MGEREADWDPRINFISEFKGDKSRNLPEKVPSSEFQEMLSEERMNQEIFLVKKKKSVPVCLGEIIPFGSGQFGCFISV